MSAPTSPLSPISSNPMPPFPSDVQEPAILPRPLAAESLPVGQFVSKSSKLNPTSLFDRDFDDTGCSWYKDVVTLSTENGNFKTSHGGVAYLLDAPEPGSEIGFIEAEEMRVRKLKNDNEALSKCLKTGDAMSWVKDQAQKGDIGFVTAVREVKNVSYKRARLIDIGNGKWQVERELGGKGGNGKRRDSGLDVQTGSKRDAVGVTIRKVVVEGDNITLGEEMSTELFASE